MKDIIIAGAGGFGIEAVEIINAINKVCPEWRIKGFINDIPDALERKNCDYSIIGTINDCQPQKDEYYIVGISSPKGKEKVATLLEERGAKFATLIHPAALVSEKASIGKGCVIGGRSSVGANTIIGNFVHLAGSMVGGGAIIGDYSTTTGFANITNAQLGKRVFVGSHAVILNNKKIGDDAFICAGSIVFNNVKAGTKVFGNPAKRIEI